MVLGKHAVALFADLTDALGVGGGKVQLPGLPPGQKGKLRAPALFRVGGAEQLFQRQSAQLLQKAQFAVQRRLQHRMQGTGSGAAHTYRLCLQGGGAQVIAPVGGVLKQCRLKLRHRIAHSRHAAAAGVHAVGKVHKLCHHWIFQQGAEDHKPVETGVPFSQFHFPVLYKVLFPWLLSASCQGARRRYEKYTASLLRTQ